MTGSAAVADAFAELVCTDSALLRLEFDSIVAAGLLPAGDEPVPRPPAGRRLRAAVAGAGRRPVRARRRALGTATRPGRARRQYPRERSPPPSRTPRPSDESTGR